MNPNEAPKVCESGSGCCGGSCKCHGVGPIVIMLIGLAFLLQAFNVLSAGTVAIAWPILLMILGAAKMCKCCSHCKK